MARRRIPRELRRRTWAEGTAWELLVMANLLPYRFASPFADLGMTPRQRRELRREEALLKGTTIAYILPQPARPRRPSQPWLYVRTQRGGHYRVGEAGEIERFGRVSSISAPGASPSTTGIPARSVACAGSRLSPRGGWCGNSRPISRATCSPRSMPRHWASVMKLLARHRLRCSYRCSGFRPMGRKLVDSACV